MTKKTRRTKTKAKVNGATKTGPATAANAKIFARVQDSFRDAGEALRQAGGLAGDQSRKIALKVIANAEENMTQGFDTLRAVFEADNFAEALKIQQEALRVIVRHVPEPAAQRLLLEKGDADFARG